MNHRRFHHKTKSHHNQHLQFQTYRTILTSQGRGTKSNALLDFFLRWKIHVQRTILTSQGRGTKSHVLFLIRALNSDCTANFQLGSDKASLGFLRSGEMVCSSMVTERLKSFLGLSIPRMLWVAMVRVGGAGGADGVGDGEVSGESIEVEEDVMVVVGEVLGGLTMEGDGWSVAD